MFKTTALWTCPKPQHCGHVQNHSIVDISKTTTLWTCPKPQHSGHQHCGHVQNLSIVDMSKTTSRKKNNGYHPQNCKNSTLYING